MKKRELIWRNLVLSVRRSGRDAGARRVLIRLGFIAAYVVGEGLLLYREDREAGPGGLVFSAVVGVLALGVAWFIARNNARSGDSLLKLSVREPPGGDDLSEHRITIVRELVRRAVLVDRAGNETMHQMKALPAEHVGITRQRTLGVARGAELWEGFSAREQDLLISAEGSWEWDEIQSGILQIEDVRVMRWVIGVDEVLVPFEFLERDLKPALEVTALGKSLKGDRCLASYDLRPAQTMARTMVERGVAEGVRRGLIPEMEEDAREHYLQLAERMGADEGQDLLIGTETVGKAEWEEIRWAVQMAVRRDQVLSVLIDYLNGPAEGNLVSPSL